MTAKTDLQFFYTLTGHKSKNWFESKSQMNFNVQKTMYIQVMPTFLEKSKKKNPV